MKQWFPHYYSDFQCIGSACQDNCCIGWEIGIDAETLKFYRQVPGALGQKLAQNISSQTPAHFLLTQKNGILSIFQTLLEFRRLGFELLIGELGIGLVQGLDLVHNGFDGLELLGGAASEQLFQQSHGFHSPF